MSKLKNFCHVPFRELYIEHNSFNITVDRDKGKRFRVNDKIEEYVNPNENSGYRSCCVQDISHKGTISDHPLDAPDNWFNTNAELNKTRELFLKDKRPSNCAHCWIKEDRGLESSRQKENWKYENKFRKVEPTDVPELEVLDIRLSNKCNLQCKMCYSGNSDQIAKNIVNATKAGAIKNNEYWQSFNAEYFKDSGNLDPVKGIYEFIIANKGIRELRFAGGESFVMPEVEELLVKLINIGRTNLFIFFLTNCTTVKTNVLNLLKKFDNVEVCCSIDGTGKWIEYQRYPTRWETVKRNYVKLLNNGMETSLSPCWSHLNILGLPDFLEWAIDSNPINIIGYGEVTDDVATSYLHWSLVPLKYRTEMIKKLDTIDLSNIDLEADYYDIANRLRTEVRNITDDERTKLNENVKLWDFNNPVKYRDMFPWASELLGE